MSATIIALAKLLASALSAGLLYQGFSPSQHGVMLTKIAGVIISICTIVALIPDVRDFFTPAEASQTEQKFWEGVLKYRDEHKSNLMDCEYSKKYPDGQFIVLAKAECPDVVIKQIPTLVAEVEPAPAPAPVARPVEEWQTIERYQVKDGLVKDTQTNLMWMRCSLRQIWNGSTCTGDAEEYSWDTAIKQTIDFGGFNDWRLPTREELQTLVYCSSGLPKSMNDMGNLCDGNYIKPTIKSDAFPNTPAKPAWSSSSYDAFAWVVDFSNGDDFYRIDKHSGHVVRLVRSGR